MLQGGTEGPYSCAQRSSLWRPLDIQADHLDDFSDLHITISCMVGAIWTIILLGLHLLVEAEIALSELSFRSTLEHENARGIIPWLLDDDLVTS